MSKSIPYDAIIVGAGHAGVEAALAIARCGFKTLLLTMNKNSICQMSCNPAIGGLAKGHVVREIDALGGQMAITTDQTAIQFRMLNQSKGPAVWAPRAQSDKKQYQAMMKNLVEAEAHLELIEDQATEIIVESKTVIGVKTALGKNYFGKHVVITTGTFMRGLIHVGDINFPGGRGGDPPSIGLSDSLKRHGIEMIRFKTGTPPRLRKTSIDFSKCEEQKGDENPRPFSFQTKQIKQEQLSCYLTYTNEKTHEIIRNNLHRSPLYGGIIKGVGPRYCPSIEDKVVKFGDKNRHQIYLEPEGRDTEEIYVNGISTSLPHDVQIELVRSIQGLENAELIRFGYAIEYDCAPPTQLFHSLETKKVKNLFLAGQINCTSGYEEAAAQGLIAGLNVIRKLRGEDAFVLSRSEAYIGVLIDDLVTVGTSEPYRLFTSRAEFRLLLRQDNADERLMNYGYELGLISKQVWEEFKNRKKEYSEIIEKLRSFRIENQSGEQWLKNPLNSIKSIQNKELQLYNHSNTISEKVEIDIKYEGYIKRQLSDVEKFKKLEKRKILADFNYSEVYGIRREAKEKFDKIKPSSIGQAARIPGITPADISILAIHLEKLSRSSEQSSD